MRREPPLAFTLRLDCELAQRLQLAAQVELPQPHSSNKGKGPAQAITCLNDYKYTFQRSSTHVSAMSAISAAFSFSSSRNSSRMFTALSFSSSRLGRLPQPRQVGTHSSYSAEQSYLKHSISSAFSSLSIKLCKLPKACLRV